MIFKPSVNDRRINRLSVFLLIALAVFTSCWDGTSAELIIPADYHDPSEVRSFLEDVEAQHSDIAHLETVGYSVRGEEIIALVISDNPGDNEDEPRVRLTGTIHGDEIISGEILIRLIEELTGRYETDPDIKELVDNRYIVIIPVMNPDGMWDGRRHNANNVDLNRNFSTEWSSTELYPGAYAFSEPESAALRDYFMDKNFHLSATFHAGTVIVNLPWDYIKGSLGGVPVPENRPLEDELLWALGKTYSLAGTFLANPDILTDSDADEGVINGGDWYVVNGSLQDWSYRETGCVDITIEIADNKSPETEEGIDEVFAYNRESLLAYIDAAGMGVSGYVEDADGYPLYGVAVKVVDGDIITHTDENGWFHRILLNGEYTLEFSLDGYEADPVNVTVPDTTSISVEMRL